jgi:hypothetical protein
MIFIRVEAVILLLNQFFKKEEEEEEKLDRISPLKSN